MFLHDNIMDDDTYKLNWLVCILYINSLRPSMTEVLRGGGREKQRATRGDPCQSMTECGFRVTMQASVLQFTCEMILQSDFSGRFLYVFSRMYFCSAI
jgi:hypothetical protein